MLLVRAARTFFNFCNTSRAGASFSRLSVQSAKSIGPGSVFQWPPKIRFLAEGCRKNQSGAFGSGFIVKICVRNVYYFPGKTHTFQMTLQISMFFACFWVGPEFWPVGGVVGGVGPLIRNKCAFGSGF